eukprot:7514029-Prorocentrum_lima.AAC.1
MIADPLTKGKTQRHVLNTVLHNGEWVVEHETKKWSFKPPPAVALFVQIAHGLNPLPRSTPRSLEVELWI